MARREFRAVVLDLYDTLVRWDPSQLPEIEWRGRTISQHRSRSRSRFSSALRRCLRHRAMARRVPFGVVEEIIAERERDGIEITCHERFVRALSALRDADRTRARRARPRAPQIHMGHVRRVTSAPAERVAAVRQIAPHYRLGLLSNFDDSETGREVLLRHRRLASVRGGDHLGRTSACANPIPKSSSRCSRCSAFAGARSCSSATLPSTTWLERRASGCEPHGSAAAKGRGPRRCRRPTS